MLLYVDISALVPLIVDDPHPRSPRRLAARRDALLVRPPPVETAAALAQAHRIGRLTTDQLASGLRAADVLLRGMYLVSVTPAVATAAADIAVGHGLRGYDARARGHRIRSGVARHRRRVGRPGAPGRVVTTGTDRDRRSVTPI